VGIDWVFLNIRGNCRKEDLTGKVLMPNVLYECVCVCVVIRKLFYLCKIISVSLSCLVNSFEL